MRVILLDTHEEVEMDHIEAVKRICAGMAAEVSLAQDSQLTARNCISETAMLNRAGQTAMKPRPQPRPTPNKEKRRNKSR